MNTHTLNITPLTQNAFSEFGEVISIENNDFEVINSGHAKKYANLINIDIHENSQTALNIFVTKQRQFPLSIDILEKHPLSSQSFISKSNKPFIVVVAPPSKTPNISDIKAFITNGEQGVNYAKNTWHFPLISLDDNQEFIVIDQVSNQPNCIEYQLDSTVLIQKPIL